VVPASLNDDLGLLLLDPTGSQALKVAGNGSVTANGNGSVVVNSNSSSAAAFLSGNATVTAKDIDVTGGAKTAGKASFSQPVDQEAATSDPLGLGLPSAPPTPTFSAVQDTSSTPLTLQPGTYVGGISISGSGPVTLAPGVYYMEGGGFSVSGQGNVSGTGVTIINAPGSPSDTISVSGQGSLNLTAPSSGPYQGITIFQDPSSGNPIQFTSKGPVTLTGAVYAPKALVSITGNAEVTINPGPGTAGTQSPLYGALIAYDLDVEGKGALRINPDPPPPPSVGNAGFEQPNLGTGFSAFRDGAGGGGNPGTLTLADQGGSGWTFTPNSGIAANGSAFNVTGADGNQAGFLHYQSSISQAISGFNAQQGYVLSFMAEGRGTQAGTAGSNDFDVLIDGTPVTFHGATSITPNGGVFTTYTSDPFFVTAGTHTLTFNGLDTLGGDRTSFIDDVSISDPPAVASSASPQVSSGTAVVPSAASGVRHSDRASDQAGFWPLLSQRDQVLASKLPPASVSASTPSTSPVNPAVLDQLFSGGLDGVSVIFGRQQKHVAAGFVDSPIGLVLGAMGDELFSDRDEVS
jgi:hypothetical protein